MCLRRPKAPAELPQVTKIELRLAAEGLVETGAVEAEATDRLAAATMSQDERREEPLYVGVVGLDLGDACVDLPLELVRVDPGRMRS